MSESEKHATHQAEPLTPEQQVVANANTAAAVQQAMAAIFANLGPVLERISLTPEKLRESMKPYVDPASIARELRERQQMREQDALNRKMLVERQANCSHKDKNEKWAIQLTHNFPDHAARGTCPLCMIWIHPAEWRIGTQETHPYDPVANTGRRDHAYIEPEHPLYKIVRQLESMSLWFVVAGLGILTLGHSLASLLS